MEVLVFSSCYLPGYKGGGPIKTIKNLFDQVGRSISFSLITGDRDLGDSSPYTTVVCGGWNEVGNASVFYASPGVKGLFQIALILSKKRFDMVYLNSFFSVRYSFIPLLISKLLCHKVIVAPRGEFSDGALALKSTKKRLFIWMYRLLRLHHGTVFQVSSEYEAGDTRKALGNNVDIVVAENIGAQEFASDISRPHTNHLRAVFVSRISPKKNLLAALEMLRNVKHPVEYHIYGPIEDPHYWAECEEAIEKLPPHVAVTHKGELRPDQVISTLSIYDLFFLPTKGENYGHVIAEALCAGLPILIADTTPWRNLQEQGLGWDLSLSAPDNFSAVIDQLAEMSTDEYRKMREHVLSWAKNKFSQSDAIEANVAMFRYVYEKT